MMNTQQIVSDILRSVLQIDRPFTATTPLLGAIPEFDSMAVIAILSELENQLGIAISDDEISAEIFENFGQLQQYVDSKLAA